MTDAQVALYTHINITLQALSCAVLAILVISVVSKQVKSKQTKLFLTTVIIHTVSTLCNTAAWLSFGKTEFIFRALNQGGVFLTFLAEAFLAFFFLLYVLSGISYKADKSEPKLILRSIGALGAVQVILTVFNLFGGFIYTIDGSNTYQPGGYYWLPHAIVIVQITLSNAEVFRLRKLLDKRDVVSLFSFLLMPVLALFVNIAYPHIELSFPAVTLALLLVYVNVQIEQEKRLMHCEKQLAQQKLELAKSRAAVMLSRLPAPVQAGRIRVQCFGSFEVFADGKPLYFPRKMAKEVFAYLVYRKGASCTVKEIAAALLEDKPDGNRQIQTYIGTMMKVLDGCGEKDVIIKNYNALAVDTDKLDCDYYRFLDGDEDAKKAWAGEFMSSYSWADHIAGYLSA